MKRSIAYLLSFLSLSCSQQQPSLNETLTTLESIQGTDPYNHSPYITAGDRMYAIGAQDGSFPEIGWHIDKEMGGVWNHPIKVLDGFQLKLNDASGDLPLPKATFLNYPLGNKFVYTLEEARIAIEQVQFVPDHRQGMIVAYTITNNADKAFEGHLQFQADFDLRPTWLGERAQMHDAADTLYTDQQKGLLLAKDTQNEWYGAVAASEPFNSIDITGSSYQGYGKTGIIDLPLSIAQNGEKNVTFYIASSYTGEDDVLQEVTFLKSKSHELLLKKIEKVREIERTAKLTTSDPEFDTVFRWIKYNSDWFIREVPDHGRGIAAGYPDYPWWFGCDSEYALQGYLAIGNFDLTRSTIDLLASLSRKTNPNGRIVHEASTNGVVFNPGNVNETPQFASLLWQTYLWTGDRSVLTDHFDLVQKGMQWLTEEKDTNKNGFPEGSGMMEVHGLDSEMIDVASYTQRGLADAARIARVLDQPELADAYEQKAEAIREKINTHFWVADFNSFGDFIANDQQTLRLIEDAIVRADTLNKPWAVKELKQTKTYLHKNPSTAERPFVLHHNWVVNTPMEMGIADADKAQKALQTGRQFVNPFGVFVTGIDRDESAGMAIGSFKGSKVFSYTGAVMTLPTGVSAVAENNYGNPNHALDYLKRMGRSFSYALPGSIYEVSPDYGMFAQAWNIYSYAVPVVKQFFGIHPKASEKLICIVPLMPDAWEFAHLEHVKIGKNEISIRYDKTEEGYTLSVSQKVADWDIEVSPTEGFELVAEKEGDNTSRTYTYKKIGQTGS